MQPQGVPPAGLPARRYVIDNRCGLVDPVNPYRCGREIASSERASGSFAVATCRWPSTPARACAWIEPVAKKDDDVAAIGDLYRFDRFTAPAALCDDLQRRYPDLLGAG